MFNGGGAHVSSEGGSGERHLGQHLALHPSAGLADCSLVQWVQWVQRGSCCAEQRLAWRSGSQNTGSASSWGSPMARTAAVTALPLA